MIFYLEPLLAQQGEYLTQQQILNLLKRKVIQEEIIRQVERFGVDFKLDWQITAELVREGATNELLKAIDKNYSDVLRITTFKSWWPFGSINITPAKAA